MEAFQWQQARSPEEAATLVTQTTAEAMLTLQGTPSAQQAVLVKAGGVDLLDLMKEGLVNPRCLMDISQLAELQGISHGDDGSLRIGALTTLAQIATHPGLRQPARKSATAPPWAEIYCNDRAAGTCAPPPITACARAADTASPLRATIATTPFLATTAAPLSIPLPQPPRSWLFTRRWNFSSPRASDVCFLWRIFSFCRKRICTGKTFLRPKKS